MNNIECYKCHNYGHMARSYRYKMESTMNENIDDENKKVWKGKQVHDEQVQDDQEKKEGNKVLTVILSRFIMDCEESTVALINDSIPNDPLNDTLF